MFTEYDNTTVSTIALLNKLKVKVNDFTVNNVLQNHPNYPSLLSISDALNLWNTDNVAAKIETKYIDNVALPFLAYTNYIEHPYVLVTKIMEDKIEIITKNNLKTTLIKRDEFLKHWNGVYLIAESTELSGEENYYKNKLNKTISRLTKLISALIFVAISIQLLKNNLTIASINNSTPIFIQYVISLFGIIITSILLLFELDNSNPIINKVCSGIIKSDCKAIINSKASKLFKWLSWSEIGFFYFTGCFLSIIFFPTNVIPHILNLIALPYILFSIYFQGFVAKEWCLLCLLVQALLLTGGINIYLNDIIQTYTFTNYITIALLYLLPGAVWHILKPVFQNLQESVQLKKEYNRLKFDSDIFFQNLEKQKQINQSNTDNMGILLGNPDAQNTIIKVCNPYCNPCSIAHEKLENLLHENNNLKIRIIFTASNDQNDTRFKPVRHLLSIADKGDTLLTKQALDDWYLAKEKNYDVFSNKYSSLLKLDEQYASRINEMSKWCKENGITFTPTFFFNGYQLPDSYNIEDLKYFLSE
jgi:uncharacterized membrane protein